MVCTLKKWMLQYYILETIYRENNSESFPIPKSQFRAIILFFFFFQHIFLFSRTCCKCFTYTISWDSLDYLSQKLQYPFHRQTDIQKSLIASHSYTVYNCQNRDLSICLTLKFIFYILFNCIMLPQPGFNFLKNNLKAWIEIFPRKEFVG